jgi:peptidoglycan/LPS O-acetylase OafA/YrhL
MNCISTGGNISYSLYAFDAVAYDIVTSWCKHHDSNCLISSLIMVCR